MTITETLLTFVGVPAAVVVIVYGLVYATNGPPTGKRYRPGRPFTSMPVWYLANRSDAATTAGSQTHAVAALPAGDDDLATVHYGETGGASDSW